MPPRNDQIKSKISYGCIAGIFDCHASCYKLLSAEGIYLHLK